MTTPDKKTTAPLRWPLPAGTVRKIWIAFAVALVLITLAKVMLHPHAYFGIDGTFGFYSWFGFLASAVMVLVAKGLGMVLKRKDTYYDR